MIKPIISVGLAQLAYECSLMRNVIKPLLELEQLYHNKTDEMADMMRKEKVKSFAIMGTSLEARLYPDGAGIVPAKVELVDNEPTYEPLLNNL